MTINSSGPVSIAGSTTGQSIAVEVSLSSTGQLDLNSAIVRNLAGSATFVGTISGTTLTVSSVTVGTIVIGQYISGGTVITGTKITAGSGTSWTVSVSQNVSTPTTIYASGAGTITTPNTSIAMPPDFWSKKYSPAAYDYYAFGFYDPLGGLGISAYCSPLSILSNTSILRVYSPYTTTNGGSTGPLTDVFTLSGGFIISKSVSNTLLPYTSYAVYGTDSSGNVYMSASGPNVYKFDSSGTYQYTKSATVGSEYPIGWTVVSNTPYYSTRDYLSVAPSALLYRVNADTNAYQVKTVADAFGGTGVSSLYTVILSFPSSQNSTTFCVSYFSTDSDAYRSGLITENFNVYLSSPTLYGVLDYAYPISSYVDASGNLYLLMANIVSNYYYTKLILAKFNSSGVLQWCKSFFNAPSGSDVFATNTSIAVDTSGNVYVLAYDYYDYGLALYVFHTRLYKLDSSGNYIFCRSITATTTIPGVSYTSVQPLALNIFSNDSNSLYIDLSVSILSSGQYSNGILGCVLKVPLDGTGTGTYSFSNGISIVYASATDSVTTENPNYTIQSSTFSTASSPPTITTTSSVTFTSTTAPSNQTLQVS